MSDVRQQSGRKQPLAVPTTRAGHAEVKRMKTLQNFASVHANVSNHFSAERHLERVEFARGHLV